MKLALQRFKSLRVLVVGDLVADQYVYGQTERVSREAPVLIVRHERDEVKLGGGANVAANARALGARVTALGVLGPDDMGRAMRQLFKAQGIELVATPTDVTETKTRVLAGGLSTSRQQMLRLDRGLVGPMNQKVAARLEKSLAGPLAEADVVIVSDYGAGVMTAGVRAVLQRAAAKGTKVCVDSRFSLSTYLGFTVCKPNEPELSLLTGMQVRDETELAAAAERALERLSCEVLLVTRGRRGMAVFSRGQRASFIGPTGPLEAVDVTGAGDTVSATFALAFGSGADPVEAARLANVAGSLVVQKQGTATVSAAELRAAAGL